MTFTHTPAYARDWRLRVANRWNRRPSNAKYRCVDCTVEVCKGAVRCSNCGMRAAKARVRA